MKKITSLLLTIIFTLSLAMPVFAAENNNPTITVQSVSGSPGSTVDVDVTIKNNPGILGATLSFTYDNGLTLTGATAGDAFSALTMTKPGKFTSPCNFTWDAQDISTDDIKDGTIITLQFKISDTAENGTDYNITVSYAKEDIIDANLNPVDIDIKNGTVTAIDYMPGDLNSDKKVNPTDIILLRRFIAGGYEQSINESAADVNNDGKKNPTDVILIRRYIAGGYGVDLMPSKPLDPNDPCAHGHTIVIDEAVEPTYETTGLTEGKHCSVCNTVIVAQEIIPILQKDEYSIQYVCDMVPMGPDNRPITYEPDTYKPTQTKILPVPKMDTYKFLGWSDKSGRMYGTELPKGTMGDLVLYANWASDRNKAEPVANLGDPIICEDSANGQILFVYEIGKIKNIPLFETQDLLVANGLITSTGIVKQTSITKGNAEEIGKTIANTTTNSSTWTLSKEWNESTTVSEEWAKEQGMTVTEAEEFCKSNSNTYNMSNSSGGSSSLVNSDNSSYRISANKAHTDSTYNEKQKYTDFYVDGKLSNTFNFSTGIGIPLEGLEANVGMSNTTAFEIGAGYDEKNYTRDIKTGTDSWSKNLDIANAKSSTATSTKTWNSSQGFSSSQSTSSSQSVSKAVSELISQKHSKDSTYSTGGSEGESKEYASSKAQEDLYSSSTTYSEAEINISERKFESTGNTYGAYRLVQVGMAHVFGVVGYDIKNKSYYTYTYTLLDDDEYKEYLDYSYDRTFNDYETSVLPFEIPGFVNDYVNSRIASSKLQINDNGVVTKYLGDADDEIVLIPSYYTKTNTTTGEPEFHKITGIAPGLFKNNTSITGISLGNFVNEIPNSAFEGCTALKEIVCPNVISIGTNAFKGCSSLSEFSLPNEIEFIGNGAFDGIPAIKSTAPTKEIANIVANSNARNITLDISNIEADDFSDMSFDVGEAETFKLLGGYKEYRGLTIKSDAQNTIISGITVADCDRIPIEVSSTNVTLERVTVHGDGFALVLKADETTLSLEGESNIRSESANSIITKNINIVPINEETYSAIETNGNVLVCGAVDGDRNLTFKEGEIKYITEEEYVNYLTSRKVTFDANGGVLGTEVDYKTIPYNSAMGELPLVSRDYYTFDGWYTMADGGEKITADTIMTSLTDMMLYAHWIQNDVSAWTPVAEVPNDVEIVDRKWNYTLTSYTTSNSSSLSGWIKYDTKRTGWGGTIGPVYSNPSNGARNVWSEQYVASTTKHYKYYHRWNGSGLWGSNTTAPSWAKHTCDLTYSLSPSGTYGTSIQFYGNHKCSTCGANHMWIPDGTYTTNNYSTRWYYQEPVYTYYYSKTENKEATEEPSGDNISNIQEYVQYRVK